MKPWVIVDISYLAHRARYASADLQWGDLPTGVLFGFWEQLRAICTDPQVNSNRMALCFDSKQSYRRMAFPEYKQSRRDDKTPEEREQLNEMYLQIKLLRRTILPSIGFKIYRQVGCESDDIMAQIAEQISLMPNERGVIVTADGDLYQCICNAIHWYDPSHRKLHTPETFRKEKGIPARNWGQVKAIAGCPGDGVPGIKRVGESTAVKWLWGKLPSHHKTCKAIESPEGQAIIKRNIDLVMLPHPKTKAIQLEEPSYNINEFWEMCERYGFRSYLEEPKRTEWMEFFGHHREHTRKRGLL